MSRVESSVQETGVSPKARERDPRNDVGRKGVVPDGGGGGFRFFECHPVCGSEHVLAAGVQRGLIEITLKVIESGGLLHDAVRDLLGQARPEFRQLRLKGRAVSEVRKKANLRRLPPTFIAM